MTVSQAVSSLRSKLRDSPQEYADRIGVALQTVYRYQSGARKPNQPVLKRLATIADEAGLDVLRDFFVAKRKHRIAHNIEMNETPGYARRVTADDIDSWMNWLSSIRPALTFVVTEIEKGVPDDPQERAKWLLDIRSQAAGADGTIAYLCSELEPYLAGYVSPIRMPPPAR